MISGRQTVETAGEPVRLWPVPLGQLMRVEVDVLSGNTTDSKVYIGGPETSAGTDGEMGRPLYNRTKGPDSWVRENIDPFHIWIDVQSGNDGEGVSFCLHGVGDE